MTGAELKHIRRCLGLTCRGLAMAIGWKAEGERNIRRYEDSGKPIPPKVVKLVLDLQREATQPFQPEKR